MSKNKSGLGNCLTRLSVNIKTRDHLRRIETGKFSQINGIDGSGSGSGQLTAEPEDMDEYRPLLPGRHFTSASESGFWRHLFLDPKSSPGTDSHNPFVRWPAHVWNVTKVTLFSCMYSKMKTGAIAIDIRILISHHSLDQPSPCFRAPGYSCREARMGCHLGVLSQLLRHHPAGRCAVVCD